MHPVFAFLGLTWHWPFALALAPACLLLMILAAFLHRRRSFRLARLGYNLPRGLTFRFSFRSWLLSNFRWFCGLILLTVGVAGPIWGMNSIADVASERDLIVVVDLSRSMLATDVLPNRCGRACDSIQLLCDHLEKRGGVRLALVGFASQGRLLCPLTRDYQHVRELAAGLDPASPPAGTRPDKPGSTSGTRLGEGLQAAAAAVDPVTSDFADIVLLSDGDDPANDQEFRAGIKAVQAIQAPVHVIGIGNPQASWDLELPMRRGGKQAMEHVTTSLKEKPLREIAVATGGVYVPARTQPCDLAGLYDEIIEPLPRAQTATSMVKQPPSHQGWFFAAALLFFLAEFLKVRVLLKRYWPVRKRQPRLIPSATALLLVGLACGSLAAAFPEDAESWLRAGYRAFFTGKYQEAQLAFDHAKRLTGDPGFAALDEALSHVRLGQYDDALVCARQCLEDASQERRSVALFVRGICLFRQAGNDTAMLRRAVADFREVVQSSSASADLREAARHNLELSRLVLAETAPPPGQNPKSGPDGERPGGEGDGGDGSDRPGDKRGMAADGSRRANGHDPGDDEENLQSNPGKGNLPLTIGEGGNVLSTSAALELLANAEKRIQAELLEQRRQRVLDINAPKKDW
ncbi:MAG TPA: VWA domain-containing protein [Gemmataceae bacterium]|nr:VWA domain-containing protein [Gemmataceae bacterium]